MSIVDKVKDWFARQERKSLAADQVHEEFDEETDRWGEHKDHMIDRLEGNEDG
jgi:hypothetical protein